MDTHCSAFSFGHLDAHQEVQKALEEQLSCTRTVASPDFSQMAAALSRFFAELHNIAARGLRRDGDLSHSLLAVAEVHCQNHLKERQKRHHIQLKIVLNCDVFTI